MTSAWETKFVGWSKPPSDTEEQRIENAIQAVRNALAANDDLKRVSKAYLQGSYRNRVNVRINSDVDIGVLYTGNSFYSYIPEGYTNSDFGIIDGDISYSDFKNLVQVALVNHFGANAVTRGNKAFDIHENTYRVVYAVSTYGTDIALV